MSSIGIYATNFLSKYFTRSMNFQCFDCKLISPKNYFIECQHCICQRCLRKYKYCALCQNQRIKIDGDNPTAFQFILTEIILNPYLMKCVFDPCKWEGTYYDFIKQHYQRCHFRKNRELYPEYFEEFINAESEDRNRRSKSEIKSVKKNTKKRFSLNNNSNDNSSDERDVNYSFYGNNKKDNNDKIKNMFGKRNTYGKIEKNNEIKPSQDDFKIYYDNCFSIKKEFIYEKNNPRNFNNRIFNNNNNTEENDEEESYRHQNNHKDEKVNNPEEIFINIGDDSDDEDEEDEEDEDNEEIEDEEGEEIGEEKDEKIYKSNRLDIELDFEGENGEIIPLIEEEEGEEDEDNNEDEENDVEEEYIKFVEKDTSKDTHLKENEIEEIESEDNYQDEDYEQEEMEEQDEYDESEQKEKMRRKRKSKYQKKKKMFMPNNDNYNYLNRKRKYYPTDNDYFNENNENYDDNNYNNNYKRRKIQW